MTKFSIRTIYKDPKWSGRTAIGLEHLQSLIDLRRKDRRHLPSNIRAERKSDLRMSTRITINVGGTRYETLQATLERYPNSLLGNRKRRALFYDKIRDEYFFDRHRSCFEAILYYYQSCGRLRRPDNVPLDTFLEEITFFDLGAEALAQIRHDEDLQEAHEVVLPKNRFLRHLWANLEYPQYSFTAKIINILSMLIISISAVELAVETMPKYRIMYGSRCEFAGDGFGIDTNSTSAHIRCPGNFRSPFFIIQTICIIFFTIEFLLRIISCPSLLKFIRSILNWIDLLAILPYFIIQLIKLFGVHNELSSKAYFALSFLRICRFLRVFKLYRTFHHIKSLRVLASTFRESIPDFIILFTFLTLSGFLFGVAVYYAEYDLKSSVYDSIPTATYYGIITLTAVGYGDLTPTTVWGRVLACFAAIYGISTVSMLVSVLVGRYQRVYNRKRFLNEGYSNEILFQSRQSIAVDDNHELGLPSDIAKTADLTMNDEASSEEENTTESEKPDVSPNRVRFIIGYLSDDDSDADNNTSREQDQTDNNKSELLQKIAQELLQSKTRQAQNLSRSN